MCGGETQLLRMDLTCCEKYARTYLKRGQKMILTPQIRSCIIFHSTSDPFSAIGSPHYRFGASGSQFWHFWELLAPVSGVPGKQSRSHDLLFITHYPLPIVHHPLPTTHYQLPTTHYPLPTTHSPLSPSHYPLLLNTL